MKCPLCSSSSKHIFKVNGYNIRSCQKCSHQFAEIKTSERHTTKTYGDEYFTGGGAGYTDYSIESTLLQKRGKMYAKKIQKFSNKSGRVLDVGAAAGYILKGFLDEGWQGEGIEPNEQMARYGNEQLGLDIKRGSFENFKSENRYDLISMIQVVPHFFNQQLAFKNANTLLETNGLLLIETWNRNSITAKVFGKNWHEYSPPSVLHWYTLDSLTKFVESFGFDKIASGRPYKAISSNHAKSLLKHRLGNNFLINLIPDKINLPYPSEDLFWALFKKR